MPSTVVTRFAPSPTGYLHIGGARTALFNWLFARHHGGQFLLRIEDTDRVRSTPDATMAILKGLDWLGLDHDGAVVYQFARADRHRQVAESLLKAGRAYYCYATPEELTAMREQAIAEKRSPRYDGRYRDRDPQDAPKGIKPTIRLKANQTGDIVIQDHVQGTIRVAAKELDDMVLLRADGTPTYMLAVVVDDHDMGITHVIRGDDHLTNAFRQYQIYDAMGWDIPTFAHIPLIHGPDGAKLSKRHGALGVDAYQDMGMLADGMINYLLRLGWGHGDDEIISRTAAIEWFDLDGIGRSPARFDMKKLESVNAHYLRLTDDGVLVDHIMPHLQTRHGLIPDETQKKRLRLGMGGLKQRAKTLLELTDGAVIYAKNRPLSLTAEAAHLCASTQSLLRDAYQALADDATPFTADALTDLIRSVAERGGVKMGALAQPLRAALTGQLISPSIFEVMEILGKEETLGRIQDVLD